MASESLRVVAGNAIGAEIPIGEGLFIGRSGPQPGDLGGDDPELSRNHARISRRGEGQLVVEDLGSMNGSYLNGWRIPSPQVLSQGDRLQFGQTVLELQVPVTDQATVVGRRRAILPETDTEGRLRPEQRESVLYATDVRKSYGDREILKGVDLEIQPGEIVGLLGPNGAGKTTFVSIVAGLRPADGGTIHVAGVDALGDPQAARRMLGLAPQDLGIYPTLSVRRNLLFFGELAGLRGSTLANRIQDVGDALSLTPLFDRSAGRLSGGQMRRLHTAMAMLHAPPLLILDEPTVGADVRTRQEILDLVRDLAGEGRAICYSTHYLSEVEALGASVAILEGGRIIARGSIAELVARHSSQAVEFHFDGPAPDLAFEGDVVREDSVIRIKTEKPDQVAASALTQLGLHALRLKAVEIIRPSLESVYLTLTERRYLGLQEAAPG